MLNYLHQDSTQTLRQALDNYYQAYPWLIRGPSLSAPAREFFACHDTVHVVYGCDTTLAHELIVKIASLFGTTAGFSVLTGYRLHESFEIYRRLSWVDVASTALQALLLVPRTALRSWRQPKRWPWSGYEHELDQPLAALRQRYGIRVADNRRT